MKRMPPPQSSLPRSSAFTLIELLVVVAIIGILAAILIPAISRVRATAAQAQCASNLRQFGMVFQRYLQDNNNRVPLSWVDNETVQEKFGLPYRGGWMDYFMGTYVSDEEAYIMGCPVQRANKQQIWESRNFTQHEMDTRRTYSYNDRLTSTTTGPRTTFTYDSPAQTIFSGDGDNSDGGGQTEYYNSNLNPDSRPPEAVHYSHANILFLDGHVESMHADAIPRTYAPGSKGRLFWYGTYD